MLSLVKFNPEYSSKKLVEANGPSALFLFLLAAKKKAVLLSFRWDTKILTADRTTGSAAVCKDGMIFSLHNTVTKHLQQSSLPYLVRKDAKGTFWNKRLHCLHVN